MSEVFVEKLLLYLYEKHRADFDAFIKTHYSGAH